MLPLLLTTNVWGSDLCEEWFKNSKVQPGPDCLTRCASLPTGLKTFNCTLKCEDFCKDPATQNTLLGKLLYYPGLTKKEQQLVRQYPTQALTVYRQKGKAEKAAKKIFSRDAVDDESDAFRHFVWAALLAKELGPNMAKRFLDAHEADRSTSDPSRAMDLANNRAGLLIAEQLRQKGKLTEPVIIEEALAALRNKTLVVRKPKGVPR